MTNSQEIKRIVESIRLGPEKRILLNDKPWGEEFKNPYTKVPSNKMLFDWIQQLIYEVYYTRIGAEKQSQILHWNESEIFMNELSSYNKGMEEFDRGWMIEQVDLQGQVTARKANYSRLVLPGEFINESGFHQKPVPNTAIRLLARKEHKDPQTGFYYVFSRTLAEDVNEMLVRIYFHIPAEGAAPLVEVISSLLNQYQVPFSFKCLNQPLLYHRADAAVLYFDKRYCHILFMLLPEIYGQIKKYLKEPIPLFTKKLANGLGFAENPVNPDESFGTHICKMITQGLMHCFNHQVDQKNYLHEVKENIQTRHGYKDIENLHINPGTHYPYTFPTLS